MGFDGFVIISLIYGVIGLQAIYKMIRSWSATWDRNFTQQDRFLVDQAAFFVLVPVSVVLHEFGHAIAIWAFGGEVVDYGFYGFAGYVSYDPRAFTLTEQMIVSAAGTIVNLLLCLGALGWVFFRKPPSRAAINELLIQFAFISGINAFIAYPVLDLVSGLNGDWRQMYDGGVPWLTLVIVIGQAAVIGFGYWLFTNPVPKARMAQLTDTPPGLERAPLGGLRRSSINQSTLSPTERVMHEAVSRVSSGWPASVRTGVQRFPQGAAISLEWSNSGHPQIVAIRAFASGRSDIIGFRLRQQSGGDPPPPLVIHSWPEVPDVDTMTLGLRLAMEKVQTEGW